MKKIGLMMVVAAAAVALVPVVGVGIGRPMCANCHDPEGKAVSSSITSNLVNEQSFDQFNRTEEHRNFTQQQATAAAAEYIAASKKAQKPS